MKTQSLLLLIGLLAFKSLAQQDDAEPRQYLTARAASDIQIDGKLDDDAWNEVEWGGDFIQREPDFGIPPSQETQFKILYDDKFLYIGVRAFDTEPEKIVKRMSRRDGFEGDWVEVNIDSYHDKRTAFSFTASVSGVIGDEYITNNGDNWDSTWDPIWYLKTSIDDEGWIAEYKIPLSQLRFADVPEHTWGIQITRRLFREEERSVWQPIPQDAPGWVHLFGELKGIKGIKPQKQLEIQPYVVGKADRYEGEEGNPFSTGSDNNLDVGVDAKIGITSDVTLDLTINPDFGQVEADPSQVNLSAFRLFFRERRPFFLEGNNILDFDLNNFSPDNLFYSRRIGRRPSHYPDGENIEFVDQPNFTRILGAAKLTGKNKNGFSWGFLESVTNGERAEVQNEDGTRDKIRVEPLTNYSVGRFQQDIDEGKTVVGAMITSTNRIINDEHLEFLHENAYSGGVDITHNFDDRKYYFSLKSSFSHVNGTEASILETQTASERFFQRPDNRHHNVDSTRTTLNGSAGAFSVGKAQGKFRGDFGIAYNSPEFSINDVGFLRQADFIRQNLWLQYRTLKPFGIFRTFRINYNESMNWDFDGINIGSRMNVNAHAQFTNYWRFSNGLNYRQRSVSNADLRGGPSIAYPGGASYWYWFQTNSQQKLTFSFNQWFYRGFEDYEAETGVWARIFWQPMNTLSLNLQPSVSWYRSDLQYVSTQEFNGLDRYLLGRIEQMTYRISLRSTYNITPNFSIEFWGQPFISSGEYSEFKLASAPNAENFNDRFDLFGSDEVSFDGESEEYLFDENLDGNTDYSIGDPDFNVIQFRSNFVVRWEYTPGSILFLVWSSNGSEFNNSNENGFRNLSNDLSNLNARNTFLIKYTYRFIL